jgi:hypothetical protein
MTFKLKSLVLSAVVSISINTALAGAPQRIVVIDTDDSPGNTYIDVVQGDDGALQSLVYETDTNLTFTLADLLTETAVLKQTDGKNVILLKLEQPFDPLHGGHVIVEFLNNGITDNYKDFRILIDVQGTSVTFSSDPDSTDPQSDGNSFTSVFNKLFMWKNTFLGKEIGIDRVTPSVVPAGDVTDGPAPLASPTPSSSSGS